MVVEEAAGISGSETAITGNVTGLFRRSIVLKPGMGPPTIPANTNTKTDVAKWRNHLIPSE